MYIVTRIRVSTILDEDNELVPVREVDDVHIEPNVDVMLEQMRLGDHRFQGVRIFHMGVSEDGMPRIGTEAKP